MHFLQMTFEASQRWFQVIRELARSVADGRDHTSLPSVLSSFPAFRPATT